MNALIYPAPVEEDAAVDYVLTIGGQPVFTYPARVSAVPLNQVWPGYQRPKSQTEMASFASWDMTGPVEVQVISARPVQSVRVRPSAAGIAPRVEGDAIRFTISRPGQYTLEVNGMHRALHLFANPPEQNAPDPQDPNVRYFGPGVHCPGVITLTGSQTVYLAGGAVVYGIIVAENAENIIIRGRGILDGSKFGRTDWENADARGLITLLGCNHVVIEGITLRDPSLWTVIPVDCQNVYINNVKLIGLWRYNADGIDFVNCQHGVVEDCFVRSFDDSIVFKGLNAWGRFTCSSKTIEDFRVRRCVVWNDWGRALEIGAETIATEMSSLLFEDCDIIHTAHIAMDVQNSHMALCRDMVFRNIRVEMDDGSAQPVMQQYQDQVYSALADDYLPYLIVLENTKNIYSGDSERGRIQDICFEDIAVTAPRMPLSLLKGYDAEHLVQHVSIENLRHNGQMLTDLAASGITANAFVREVILKP